MGAAILKLAMTLMEVEEEERTLLQLFCTLAEGELRQRLKPGIAAEECPPFQLGAAWLALSQLLAARQETGVRRFSAGDLTIEQGAGMDGQALRLQAERTLAGYLVDREFAFRSVRG